MRPVLEEHTSVLRVSVSKFITLCLLPTGRQVISRIVTITMATVCAIDTESMAPSGAVTLPEMQHVDGGTTPCLKQKEHMTKETVLVTTGPIKVSASQRAASEGRAQKSIPHRKCPSDGWLYVHCSACSVDLLKADYSNMVCPTCGDKGPTMRKGRASRDGLSSASDDPSEEDPKKLKVVQEEKSPATGRGPERAQSQPAGSVTFDPDSPVRYSPPKKDSGYGSDRSVAATVVMPDQYSGELPCPPSARDDSESSEAPSQPRGRPLHTVPEGRTRRLSGTSTGRRS